jgi:MFS family permease
VTSPHDPFAALRYPGFRWSTLGRFASASGQMLFAATVFWQVYDISDSAAQLAIVGLVQFIPSLGLGLVAGAVADRFNRRWLSLASQAAMLMVGAVLCVVSANGSVTLGWIYVTAFLMSVAGVFDAPARAALLPALVPRAVFPNAITVNSTVQQLGLVTGPAIAGLLIALGGPAAAYGAFVGLFAVSILAFAVMRLLPVELPKRAVSWEGIKEGVRFVRGRQVILGAMTLDMFAVIFGGAQALLPVFAEDILGVGALGYGLLAASLDVGAMSMALALVFLPPIKRTGLTLLIAVGLYGIGTIVFGLSRSFPLSLAAYAFIGMADQISVVMRQTTIQVATPDELRGRVTSVNMLFIGASNRLGAVESGIVAALTSATFAVVSGGIGCLAVLGVVSARLPELRRFRIDPLRDEPEEFSALATVDDAAGELADHARPAALAASSAAKEPGEGAGR